MHRIVVRRMGSNILAIENGVPFVAKPDGWNRTGFLNTIKKAFTLKYDVFDRSEAMVSQVEFDSFSNYILVKRESGNVALTIPLFTLHSRNYYLKEKLTGFLVWPVWDTESRGKELEIVIEGKKRMTDYIIEIDCTDENFRAVLKEFGIGLMIRWMSYLY
jgi:hypothetical protein